MRMSIPRQSPLEWPPIDGLTTVLTILHREDKELLGVRHLIQHLPARRAPRRRRFPRHGENGGTRRTRTMFRWQQRLRTTTLRRSNSLVEIFKGAALSRALIAWATLGRCGSPVPVNAGSFQSFLPTLRELPFGMRGFECSSEPHNPGTFGRSRPARPRS